MDKIIYKEYTPEILEFLEVKRQKLESESEVYEYTLFIFTCDRENVLWALSSPCYNCYARDYHYLEDGTRAMIRKLKTYGRLPRHELEKRFATESEKIYKHNF